MSEQNNPPRKLVTRTLTAAEILAMTPEEFNNVIAEAVEVRGTAVVRSADGKIKYDDPSRAGEFGEEYLQT